MTMGTELLPVKDREYWRDVAKTAHAWNMLIHQLWMTAFRDWKLDKITSHEWSEYNSELHAATAWLEAEYDLALACSSLADLGYPLQEFIRDISPEHQP